VMDVASRRARVVEEVSGGLIDGLQFARRAPVLAFTFEGPTKTANVMTYDLRRRRVTPWTESEMGAVRSDQLIQPELIRYETFDDREIPAFYYEPAGDGPFPVLVSIHGGPESQARPYYHPLYQYLLRKPVAVLVPNVRGSDGYGKSYLELDNGILREGSVKDIGALLDWIDGRDELESQSVAVYGGSYGGYMVLASLVMFGERIRAGVNIVGISNFISFLENTKEYRRDLRRAEYGDERDPSARAFLEQISPIGNVKSIQSALFVAHGLNDPRVPVGEAEQIVEAVRENGQQVWYMLAKNEGHGFRKKENRDLFYELTARFLDENL